MWVTETGTGNLDSKVSVIMPNGIKHVVVEGFFSAFNPLEGVFAGLNHLLVHKQMLWILHVDGNFYKLDISNLHPGHTLLKVSDLEKKP